jgi:hypothetical protein
MNEKIDYISHDLLSRCVLSAGGDGIPRLIENVHLNKDYPANMNVRCKSKKQGIMETFDGKRWIMEPANNVMDSLIRKGCKVINKHYLDNMNGEFNSWLNSQTICYFILYI